MHHTYNPFEQPELIACIIKNLAPKNLAKCLHINYIWEKEVKREFFIRQKKLEDRYWDLRCKIKKAIKDLDSCFEPRTHPEIITTGPSIRDTTEPSARYDSLLNEEEKTFSKLQELEKCMFNSGIIDEIECELYPLYELF